MKKKKYKGHLITHTHWDREWYQPVEVYRFRLIEVFKKLKEIFSEDNSYHSFFFDGQTIPIDDYLVARQNDKKIIAEYIKNGKLRIGPFYVLLDEQLVSGESYLRNLIIGLDTVKKYKGNAPIGYLPDNFGHISQTPQILAGFGIDNAVMWRGYMVDENTPCESWWEGADGTKIKSLLLISGYASFAGADPKDKESFTRSFNSLDVLKKRAHSKALLFMHGIDHCMPHPKIDKILEEINRYDDDIKTTHSDLESYINDIQWGDIDYHLKGEQIQAPHLDGTFSSRMHLKQMNRKCENELSYYAEPLAALSWLNGNEYPAEDLLRAWKYLIKCHPHDSITGCNSDRVAEDMEIRFARSYEMSAYLSGCGLDLLAGETFNYQDPTRSKIIAVFNPMPAERNEVIRAEIFIPHDIDLIRNIYVKQDDSLYHANIIFIDEVCWPLRSDYMIPKNILNKRLIIEFGPVKLAPFSISNFEYEVHNGCEQSDNLMDAITIDSDSSSKKNKGIYKGINTLENKFYIVEIKTDASIDVTEKYTGNQYKHLHVLEAEVDTGNLYNFAPALKRPRYFFAPQSLLLDEDFDTSASIKVSGALNVPAGISQKMTPLEANVSCPITVTITLKKNDPIIYFKTSLENNAKNICIRTLFESNIANAVNHVHTPFDIVQRKPLSEEYINVGERLVATGLTRYCSQFFTSISNSEQGMTLLNKGLPEYTFDKKGILTLTLLRSSNMIWGTNEKNFPLKEYPAETGFELGQHEREYGLMLHKGDISNSKMLPNAFGYNIQPLTKVYSEKIETPFQFNLQSESLILSAFKRSEDKKGIILRFYNILDTEQSTKITFSRNIKEILRCRLDEEISTSLYRNSNIVKINVKPKEIVTLKLCY